MIWNQQSGMNLEFFLVKILIFRYCGYILGQPTDLTSLLDILESSSSTLSSSNRDHLKNLLHSQLQNQKESNQEKTSFSLLDGIYNGKQITCKVKVENADHLSLALLMERLLCFYCIIAYSFIPRYRTECESHTLKFPFLDTSLAIEDRVSIDKLIEKWVGSSVDCESTFQKEFKNAKVRFLWYMNVFTHFLKIRKQQLLLHLLDLQFLSCDYLFYTAWHLFNMPLLVPIDHFSQFHLLQSEIQSKYVIEK